MLGNVTLEEAQSHLKELINKLDAGEEVVITENERAVAKLIGQSPKRRLRPPPGLGKGMMTIVSDDDEHLKGFP
jgi:antitoxin (DNA-binding transcriptional repressor) of toxin-antitoxin stability system